MPSKARDLLSTVGAVGDVCGIARNLVLVVFEGPESIEFSSLSASLLADVLGLKKSQGSPFLTIYKDMLLKDMFLFYLPRIIGMLIKLINPCLSAEDCIIFVGLIFAFVSVAACMFDEIW